MIFSELDFRMSVVKRWSVVSTLRQQSLAEHSFNVAIIAARIAKEWFRITEEPILVDIYKRALAHDAIESVTGDPPSYMKRWIDEEGVVEAFALEDTFDIGTKYEIARIIVKAADYIDALIFLQMEISHGNRTVLSLRNDLQERFRKWAQDTKWEGIAMGSIFEMYITRVLDPLFGENGQFSVEKIWPTK